MSYRRMLLFAIVLLSPVASPRGQARADGPAIDPARSYLLQNVFLEGKNNLSAAGLYADNARAGLASAPAEFYSGKPIVVADGVWKFQPIADAQGYYHLSNESVQYYKMLLSTEKDAPHRPCMERATPQLTMGQMWKFEPIDGQPGAFRLTNKLLEGNFYLDTSGGAPFEPFMAVAAEGIKTGQMWKLSEAGGQRVDPAKDYQLQNLFLEGKRDLLHGQEGFLPNGKTQIGIAMGAVNPNGFSPPMCWNFQPLLDNPGYFRVINRGVRNRTGPGANFYFDVNGAEPYSPWFIGQTETTTGQMWKFETLEGQPGYFRLTNKFLEGKFYLDTSGAEPYEPFMANAGDGVKTGQMWKLAGEAVSYIPDYSKPVELFSTAYVAPISIWSASWKGEQNDADHEYKMEGSYSTKNAAPFKAIDDDSTVYVNGAGGGKLRLFEDVQSPTQLALDPDGDDTSADATGKNNKATLRMRANVEFIGNTRTVTLSDASTFVNSNFIGIGNSNVALPFAVGFYLEGVTIKFTNKSPGWQQPVYGPGTNNNQVGYNIQKTKGVNVDANGMGPGVGFNASETKGSSANVADYKFVSNFDTDGISPKFTWKLGNVYDGDENAIPYKTFQDVIHRTTVDQVDRVIDVPPLAKGTFIPTAYAGWTARDTSIQGDLKVLVEYELTYREVHLKQEPNQGKAFGQGFLRGFSFLFNREFYEDPGTYFSNPNTSYATTKITQKFSQIVTVPKDDIVRPLAQ